MKRHAPYAMSVALATLVVMSALTLKDLVAGTPADPQAVVEGLTSAGAGAKSASATKGLSQAVGGALSQAAANTAQPNKNSSEAPAGGPAPAASGPVPGGVTLPPSGAANRYPAEVHFQFHPSPELAKQILSYMDGLLNFSSEASGLPIHTHVQGKLIDRKGVKDWIAAEMKKEDMAAKAQRSLLALKKLGLVPRDFDIAAFMLENSDSGLAGFYDPPTKVFYMLDWIPIRQQCPVMAHELTHALQDQYIGLESWMGHDGEDAAAALGRDERRFARRATAEGQATAVEIDYELKPLGERLENVPTLGEQRIQQIIESRNNPVLLRAPRYLRESAEFPYVYGLEFVLDVLKKGGKEQAFAGVLKNPPLNTHQVMHPATYLAGEKIPPLQVPSLDSLVGSDLEKVDSGTFGEFDALMFAEQFTSLEKARQISAQWRGGYYYVAVPKSQSVVAKVEPVSDPAPKAANAGAATPAFAPGKEDIGAVRLFYLSRWASPAAAQQFADLYASSVTQRYAAARKVEKPHGASHPGEKSLAWDTPEGPVSVETRGTMVLVLESFDQATASKLQSGVFSSELRATN